jgi:hypothetical protein
VILNLGINLVGLPSDSNYGSFASGMPMDVGQAFLHQTKNGEFYLWGKSSKAVGNIQLNAKPAALYQTVYVPAKCRGQSTFVKHWWVQKIRRGAYLLGQILN